MTDTFEWRGRTLPLLDHEYNTTALNERAWEVPLAIAWLENCRGQGLEIGNVLSHYWEAVPTDEREYLSMHRIVDLYEEAPGVDNVDVRDVQDEGEERYDWIVAISTIEHVDCDWIAQAGIGTHGWQEAIASLMLSLKRGGSMLATIPFGQNPYLDVAILSFDVWPHPVWDGTMVRSWEDGSWEWREGARIWTPARERSWAQSVWVAEWTRP